MVLSIFCVKLAAPMRSRIGICLFASLLACPLRAQDFPKVEITNGLIRAELMLPDPQNGSYRGTRFDWSGIISSLQFNGHEYFGQWYPHHDPKIHDAITGPVEEFRTNADSAGLDYDETKPGGAFVRIGVGTVRKPEEKAYRPYDTYEIVDPGKRTVRPHKDRVEFEHRLTADDGYAYVYRKTVRLVKGKPELVIEHSLKNTGSKVIDIMQYNHNFFVIDHEEVGPDVALKFAFTPSFAHDQQGRAEVHGQEIIFPHILEDKKGVFTQLMGASSDMKDYNFRIENLKTGAGVHFTADQPVVKINFWAIQTVAVAEPYIQLHIEPGKEAHWTIRYDFYTMPPAAKEQAKE
jgi:hypothetical protein